MTGAMSVHILLTSLYSCCAHQLSRGPPFSNRLYELPCSTQRQAHMQAMLGILSRRSNCAAEKEDADGLAQKVRDRLKRTAKYDCSASAFSSVSMMLLRAPLLLGAAWEAAASAADALHCKLLLRVACCRLTPPTTS